MRWGRLAVGPDRLPLLADRVYLFAAADLEDDLVVGSVVLNLDGLGAGSSQQALRPVVMEDGLDETVAVGEPVLVEEGQPAAWVHLPFAMPPRLRGGSTPLLGVATGPAGELARLAVVNATDVVRYYESVYGDPIDVSVPFDIAAQATGVLLGVPPWRPPVLLDEDGLAALPVDVVQATLSAVAAATIDSAVCGWHYSNDSPPQPASALVRTGGPLEALVGERVRVTVQTTDGPASVTAVVVGEDDFDGATNEDISLARDAYLRVASLWTDAVEARVEVLA